MSQFPSGSELNDEIRNWVCSTSAENFWNPSRLLALADAILLVPWLISEGLSSIIFESFAVAIIVNNSILEYAFYMLTVYFWTYALYFPLDLGFFKTQYLIAVDSISLDTLRSQLLYFIG